MNADAGSDRSWDRTSSRPSCAPSAPSATIISIRSTSCCTAASSRAQQVQAWALNRYYYQAMIPIKDAHALVQAADVGAAPRMAPAHHRP